jgi:hypothetical protein
MKLSSSNLSEVHHDKIALSLKTDCDFLLTPLALAAQQIALFYSHEIPQVESAASEIIANHVNIGPTCSQGCLKLLYLQRWGPNLDRIFQRARIFGWKHRGFLPSSRFACGQ